MAIMAISVAPSGTAEKSLSMYVAKALNVLEAEPHIRYEIGSMFTTIEGDLPVLMDVAQRMHEAVFEAGADRVGTVIKIDDRRDRSVRMENKVTSVKQKMLK